jgi:Tfp pilus assembly protein PilV
MRNKKKGISLIEIIISLAIIAIIIIPMSNVVINSSKRNKGGEDKQQATYIGQQVLEGLNVNPIEGADGNYLPQSIAVNGNSRAFSLSADGKSSLSFDGYNVDLAIARNNSINLSDNTNNYDATITVDWQDSTHSINAHTSSNDLNFPTDVTNLYITVNDSSIDFITKGMDGTYTQRTSISNASAFSNLGIRFKNYTALNTYSVYVNNTRTSQVNMYLEKTEDKPNWATITPNGGPLSTYEVTTSNKTINNYNVEIKVNKIGQTQPLYDLKSTIRK